MADKKKKGDKGDKVDKGGEAAVKAPEGPKTPPRLLDKYRDEITAKLKEQFGYDNVMAIPKIEKIVINMGVGAALATPKRLEDAVKELTVIAGQRPIITKARKAIAGFKLREGNAIGCKVTLRRWRMYEFLDRLINIAIPRIRDFRGVSPKAFDGRGNYTLGLAEQIIFPEINADKVEAVQGMDVCVVTSAKTDKEAYELLKLFGMPFRS